MIHVEEEAVEAVKLAQKIMKAKGAPAESDQARSILRDLFTAPPPLALAGAAILTALVVKAAITNYRHRRGS